MHIYRVGEYIEYIVPSTGVSCIYSQLALHYTYTSTVELLYISMPNASQVTHSIYKQVCS